MEDDRVIGTKEEYLKCKREAQEVICSSLSKYNAKI